MLSHIIIQSKFEIEINDKSSLPPSFSKSFKTKTISSFANTYTVGC